MMIPGPTERREPAMPTWIFEVRDSDGNDCTVYDALVTAPTRDAASDRLWKYLGECYPNDETDGGFGTYHACDCECEHGVSPGDCAEACGDSWECEHGGLLTNEDDGGDGPQEYATEEEARAAHARYHSLIDLTGDPAQAATA